MSIASWECILLQYDSFFIMGRDSHRSLVTYIHHLKSINFLKQCFWLYENKVLQLMSGGASLQRFGVFIKWRSCKHWFKNEWTLEAICGIERIMPLCFLVTKATRPRLKRTFCSEQYFLRPIKLIGLTFSKMAALK